MSNKIKSNRHQFEDGSFVEIEAYEVENTDKHPEGYKYSFQYGTIQGTILRYDNSHGKHDRHIGDLREYTEFRDLEQHLERFFEEVEHLRQDNIKTPQEINKDENRQRYRTRETE